MAKTRAETQVGESLTGLTVLEAADLAKALEEKWGVSAAAAVAVADVALASDPPVAGARKPRMDVVLTSDGGNRIKVIRQVRAITGLGLGEAKHLVEEAPSVIKEGATREEALNAKHRVEQAGGTVELLGDEAALTDEDLHAAMLLGVRQYTLASLGRPGDHLADLRSRLRGEPGGFRL